MSGRRSSSSEQDEDEEVEEEILVTKKRKLITPDEWSQKLDEAKVTSHDLNSLVMDFLVVEGLQEIAAKFKEESGVEARSMEGMGERLDIRKFILAGRVREAIEKTNHLDPGLLNREEDLFFTLMSQALVELIREDRIDEALLFAQQELGPLAAARSDYLQKLEGIMALLAFGGVMGYSGTEDLLGLDRRYQLAAQLNQAILVRKGLRSKSRLSMLLKRLIWEQEQLSAVASFPTLVDFDSCTLVPTEEIFDSHMDVSGE